MPDNISPYALLRASKPRPTPTIVTAYDLYSQAQREETPPPAAAPVQPAAPIAPPVPAKSAATPPARRTHYIAEIQSRHNAALRGTPMREPPMT